MVINCPTCYGTGYIRNDTYDGPCWDCDGVGVRMSNHDRNKASKKLQQEKLLADKNAPFVTIRVQLPMLERELSNAGEYGLVQVSTITNILKRHIIEEV